jgi:hypothetical protein
MGSESGIEQIETCIISIDMTNAALIHASHHHTSVLEGNRDRVASRRKSNANPQCLHTLSTCTQRHTTYCARLQGNDIDMYSSLL